jgi:hypothetical protein
MLKDVQLPELIFEDDTDLPYSGMYRNYHGNPKDNRIEIVDYDDSFTASSIAHEFCHHLQYLRYGFSLNSSWEHLSEHFDTYEEAIKYYFLLQPREMEALIYQNKYAKTDLIEWWLRKLVLEN